jgi:hypothetical protein
MATGKKRQGEDRNEGQIAIATAREQADREPQVKPSVTEKQVSIRLTEYEYNNLKSLYAQEGVKLSTGIKQSALWLAENGAFKVTRAGIIDRRGQES